MSQSKVLLYSSQSPIRRPEPVRGFVAVKEFGLWDLDLILGDLSAMLTKLRRIPLVNLHTVVAPVPVGIIAAGAQFEDQSPRLLVDNLMPYASRVAEHLRLDELVAFTPWKLSTTQTSHREGRVMIVSMQQYFATRKRKSAGNAPHMVELAFGLVPLLAGVIRKREVLLDE